MSSERGTFPFCMKQRPETGITPIQIPICFRLELWRWQLDARLPRNLPYLHWPTLLYQSHFKRPKLLNTTKCTIMLGCSDQTERKSHFQFFAFSKPNIQLLHSYYIFLGPDGVYRQRCRPDRDRTQLSIREFRLRQDTYLRRWFTSTMPWMGMYEKWVTRNESSGRADFFQYASEICSSAVP